MTIEAGRQLVEEIAPRLKLAIPSSVRTVGAEDHEELLQDGLALAAQLLERVERQGRQVTAGNIAYYTLLHLKSGRRSHSAARSDAMASGTQLDGKSAVYSFEEPVGLDPDTGETVCLGELLVGAHEDPAQMAARNLDWAEFLDRHDQRYAALVRCAVTGQPANSLKGSLHVSDTTLSTFKRNLAADIRESMGEDVLKEVCRRPRWKGDLAVENEKAACRAERRHA